MNLKTLGTIPTSLKSTPYEPPVPIECVLPEPVCPYAKIVALNPWKQPSTRFRVHVSKMYSCESSAQKT